MPTTQLIITRLTCISPDSAGIALGSEMSGGIRDVRAEDITLINTQSGVRIKSAPGRGAYVKDIFVKGMKMDVMKYAFWMTGAYGDHPDEHFDPKALPIVDGINFMNILGKEVKIAGSLSGIDVDPFTGICLSNVTIEISASSKKKPWNCTDVKGISSKVVPQPCALLSGDNSGNSSCPFPTDRLPIESIELKTCNFST